MGFGDPICVDGLLLGWMHRERLFPFRVGFAMAKAGGICPGSAQYPLPVPRHRSITAYEHGEGLEPLHSLDGPSQLGRLSLQTFADDVSGLATRPPRLVPLLWQKARHYNEEIKIDNPCIGGEIERGFYHEGSFSIVRNTETTENPPDPPVITPLGPPTWGLQFLFTSLLALPDPWVMEGTQQEGGEAYIGNVADMLEADQYTYMTLSPVPPVSAWDGAPNPPPYPAGAINDFAFNDCYSYKVPCYPRTDPYRYVPSGYRATIPAGMRMIIARCETQPRLGILNTYNLWYGAFYLPWWIDGNNYTWMVENFYHHYKGVTATTRIVWEDDPDEHGWFIEYRAEVEGWLAHSYRWQWYHCLRGFHPDYGGCWDRWAPWYEGIVRLVTISGDVEDEDFAAWIESQDSGWGVRYRPRYANCNDVLLSCAGVDKAMGDVYAPALVDQEEIQASDGVAVKPPCLDAGLGGSMWYVPDAPSGLMPGIMPSYHAISGASQYPSTGLIHEIQRDMLAPDGSVDRIEYGWAQLRYFTSMPTAILVGGSGLVLSEQQTITFTPHPGLGLAVFAVEEGSSDTFVINAGDSAAQVHAVLGFTAMYDPSDITVIGPVNGPYVIEFTSGANVPLISLVGNFFFNPTPVITIEVTQEAGSE